MGDSDGIESLGEAPGEQKLDLVEKAGVGCFSCLALVAGGIGMAVGVGGGALYHTLRAQDGSLAWHVATGGLIGLLAGARLFVPLEEVVFELVIGGPLRRLGRGPTRRAP